MKKAIVCGAGIGGLVSAITLASKGYEVKLFEKNSCAGGKMGELKRSGFRFDTGPSLITMPYVFKDFFGSIGRNLEDYLTFEKLESSCRYFWNDGTVFNWYSDKEKLGREIADVFGKAEAENFFRCLEYGKQFYDLSAQGFLEGEFRLRNFMTSEGLRNASKFISGRSMNDVSNKFFRSPKLRQVFNRFATYNGSSPYLAPQIFSIIPYTEQQFGPWYVKGGIYRIAEALLKICGEEGIEVSFDSRLKGNESSGGRLTSLQFETSAGNEFTVTGFDKVILNFTSVPSFMNSDYLKDDDWSSSGLILLAGMKQSYSALDRHNIFFSQDYEKEFIDIFEKRKNASDMTVYVSVSSKSDPDHAPPGCENWFVLVNTPSLYASEQWTDETLSSYSSQVIEKLESFNYVFDGVLRDKSEFIERIGPEDFSKRYGSEFGSIYGLSSNSLFTIMKRPKNRSQLFSNLFFAGGNTHPGGGVPLCFLSGKIAAEMADKSS